MIWLLFALLVLAVIALDQIAERTRTSLEAARAGQEADYADLADGLTRFQWHGDKGDPVLICIHGLSTPSYIFAPLIPHLTAQGYRVLSYDLYGRGLSDRPPGPQDRAFFLRQLQGLIEDQGVAGAVTLVGFSMGGAIATAYGAQAPDRVARLILIAPAGLGCDLGGIADFIARRGRLGDWLNKVVSPLLHYWKTALSRGGSAEMAAISDCLVDDLRVEGSLEAILSSQRHFLSVDRSEDHRRLAESGLPVLAIWGVEDDVIPASARARLAALNPNARHAVIAGAGHWLPVTHAARIATEIDEAL